MRSKRSYPSLKNRRLNTSTVITIASLTRVVTENPTIGAKKAERKVRLKLTRVDFIFDRGSPASRVEHSVLSEVFTSSQRLASRGGSSSMTHGLLRLSISLRGSYYKIDTTFDGVFPAYPHGCIIEDHLRQSSSTLCPGKAPVMMWHYFAVGIGSL